jgi:hypothetical protein
MTRYTRVLGFVHHVTIVPSRWLILLDLVAAAPPPEPDDEDVDDEEDKAGTV